MFQLPLRLMQAPTELSENASSVTLTLPTITYKARHLVIIVDGITNTGGQTRMAMRFNGDSGSNYGDEVFRADGASASAAQRNAQTSGRVGELTSTSNVYGGAYILIPHYKGTDGHKSYVSLSGSGEEALDACGGRWADTDAITSVTLLMESNNFAATSRFFLCAVDERYLIEEEILASDGTFTFDKLPTLQGDICGVGYLRSDRTGAQDGIQLTINGNTTNGNYSRQVIAGTAAATGVGGAADRRMGGDGAIPDQSCTAGAFSATCFTTYHPQNGDDDAHTIYISSFHSVSTANAGVDLGSSRLNAAAVYTTMLFNPQNGTNFKEDSMMSLYQVPKPRLVRVAGSGATHTFDSVDIPSSGIQSLQGSIYGQNDSGATRDIQWNFNNDTTASNYNVQSLKGTTSTLTAAQSAGDDVLIPEGFPDDGEADIFGGGSFFIAQPLQTDRHKHWLSFGGYNGSARTVSIATGRWENAGAITEIDIVSHTGNIAAGSISELSSLDTDDVTDRSRNTKSI